MGAPKGMSYQQRRELARWRDERALEMRVMQARSLSEIARELGITYEGARQCVKRELKRRGLRLTYAIVPATIAARVELVEASA